ncbi:MAG: bacillithiol biosynthesis deacetylase BshB1 [Chitinophagaceae bacterium]|nr:MAG: bacillithiol biosynthesis deacetylase BshB1 [Chitinophagaceae bacterium]
MKKVDILAFGAHPDDVELSCGGSIALHVKAGKKVAIVDFTSGELGTRGTPELRIKEAEKAGKILGISERENLNFQDGFFEHNKSNLIEIVKRIRHYKPDLVLACAEEDRHPDHARASNMIKKACFLAGLEKIKTTYLDIQQEAWRPSKILFYIQSQYLKPQVLIDITDFWEAKINSVLAYESQFHNPNYKQDEPETFISSPAFLSFLESRAIHFGQMLGVKYAEGFTSNTEIGIKNFYDLIFNNR